jgi:hypothetical protein
MNPIPLIAFGCKIRLPSEGHFIFLSSYDENPHLFLQRWIERAVTQIYTSGMIKNPKYPIVTIKLEPTRGHPINGCAVVEAALKAERAAKQFKKQYRFTQENYDKMCEEERLKDEGPA